jgi:hypothetical protein
LRCAAQPRLTRTDSCRLSKVVWRHHSFCLCNGTHKRNLKPGQSELSIMIRVARLGSLVACGDTDIEAHGRHHVATLHTPTGSNVDCITSTCSASLLPLVDQKRVTILAVASSSQWCQTKHSRWQGQRRHLSRWLRNTSRWQYGRRHDDL